MPKHQNLTTAFAFLFLLSITNSVAAGFFDRIKALGDDIEKTVQNGSDIKKVFDSKEKENQPAEAAPSTMDAEEKNTNNEPSDSRIASSSKQPKTHEDAQPVSDSLLDKQPRNAGNKYVLIQFSEFVNAPEDCPVINPGPYTTKTKMRNELFEEYANRAGEVPKPVDLIIWAYYRDGSLARFMPNIKKTGIALPKHLNDTVKRGYDKSWDYNYFACGS